MSKIISGPVTIKVGGVVSGAPAWYNAQASGTWKNLGSSFMTGIGPMKLSGDAANCSEVTSTALFSYSGGYINNKSFYDRNGNLHLGASLGVWGGGHNAYGGNEVVLFKLRDNTPTWFRVRDAYSNPSYSTSQNPDGTPNSRHTYQSIIYAPGTNELFSAVTGARLSQDGSSSNYSHSFDFNNPAPNGNALVWKRNPDYPDPNTVAPSFFAEITGKVVVYDSVNNRAICWEGSRYRFAAFDFVTRTWSHVNEASNSPSSYSDRQAAAHSPTKKWVLLHTGDNTGYLRAADVSNLSTSAFITLKTSGASPPGGSHGVTWDKMNSRFVVGGPSNTLYFCTPPTNLTDTWNWTQVTGGGDNVENPNWSGQGIWGRFGYVDDGVIRGFVTCTGPNARPAFFKL
ncbi:MAG: hypothetical protein AB7N80_11470 [Bdellovibrionales bacterium]